MAAYGALLSLSHTLHHLLHPPPLNNFIIHRQPIELLLVKVHFFMNFLENYPRRRSEEIEYVERRIADAAHAAEDIIESNVVDQIHATDEENMIYDEENIFYDEEHMISRAAEELRLTEKFKLSTCLYQEIETVLETFSSFEKELPMMSVIQGVGDLQMIKSSATASSSRSLPTAKITPVGFDHHVEKLMSELASDEPSRQIIPIVGMGGIGKTTLAQAVYKHPYIVEYFPVRAWVTVSQEYTVPELLQEINKAVPNEQKNIGDDLGLQLHKKLFGRKYLIVLDDMWDIQAWEELKISLPPNENGSRVLITSRLTNLADDPGSVPPHRMDFLDEGYSWDLLRKIIFGEEDCPVELEKIGKDIAEGCSGLPLALVLIGGLLAKSERIREHWEEFFARDMTFGNDERIMKILSLSYTHLPVHLKPCFLYLAVFPEDFEIRVSRLVGLWVAEGLIKPTKDKSLEEVAHEYLEDLISRNVILVDRRGSRGNVKSCKVHDRVRDLCITEAEKEKFVYFLKLDNTNISPNIETARRLCVSTTRKPLEITINALRSAPLNRSWLSPSELFGDEWWESLSNEMENSADPTEAFMDEMQHSANETKSSTGEVEDAIAPIGSNTLGVWETMDEVTHIINDFRLLKVVHVHRDDDDDEEICIKMSNICNLRYIFAKSVKSYLPMTLCWNLQTLVISEDICRELPAEIWQMPQLRHLQLPSCCLPDPPDDDQNVVVLENLHTLKDVELFKCSEQVLKRIPNLKKLRITTSSEEEIGEYCQQNIACFKKLESLGIVSDGLSTAMAFPVSLKKLDLKWCWIPWEYLSCDVGSLPNLEVLKLRQYATDGEEWNPIEGKFCRLRFLLISGSDLKTWGADNYHFPCLEHLLLRYVENLEEIPVSFAEISTLETIELDGVKDSVWTSARDISEERNQLGYEPLLIQRYPRRW